MDFHTVSELKDSVSGILSGVDLSNVDNLNGAIERAARTLMQNADVPEATGREFVTLYSGVYDYTAPDTLFGGAIIDFRPQGISRSPWDYAYRKGIEYFDRNKTILPNGYTVTFEYNKGTPIMRVAQTKTVSQITLDTMSDDTDWTAGGNASGLAVDNTVYYQEPASLRFNLAAAGSAGYLEKTLPSELDFTDYEGVGVVFLAVYIPNVSALTNLNLRLGNDSSNYWSVTQTTGFLGTWTANNWLLVAFDLANATTTGTVDESAIDYVRLTANYNGTAMSNFRVGGLWASLPSPHEVIFQSSAIFMASGEDPSRSITTDEDSIILNDAAYTILEIEASRAIAIQSGLAVSSPTVQGFDLELHGGGKKKGLYELYSADNPSEEIRATGNWYND